MNKIKMLALYQFGLAHPDSVLVPAFCVAEAVTAFHRAEAARRQFSYTLEVEMTQALRSGVRDAKDLVKHLNQAKLTNDRLINDLLTRLETVLPAVRSTFRVIPLDTDVLAEGFRLADQLGLVRMDAMVMASILSHTASAETGCPKAFLSRNTRDFGKGPALQRLKDAGLKYFGNAGDAFNWITHV